MANLQPTAMASPKDQKQKNLRTGLILATVVLVFFAGFMLRMIFFNAPR